MYGFAEAILLATLPVLAVWQATDALGWTDTAWAKVGSGALAVVGALFVILVHHLGYREFRARAARKMLWVRWWAAASRRWRSFYGQRARPDRRPHRAAHAVDAPRDEMPPVSHPEPVSSGADRSQVTNVPASEKELVA